MRNSSDEPDPHADRSPPDSRDAEMSLEAIQDCWRRAAWRGLAAREIESLGDNKDRARIAALIADAASRTGNDTKARQALNLALGWGLAPRIAAQILVSGAYNTLGRIALLRKDETAWKKHFASAMSVIGVEETDVAGHERSVREMADLGLFPDAAEFLNKEIWRLKSERDSNQQAARMTILRTELALLKEELSVAVKRSQIYRGDKTTAGAAASEETTERQSMSQLGQDLWVLERTNFKRGGFFVEFGATDGVALSNTLLLETDFAWKGLLAEPNPQFLAALRKNRRATISDACIGPVTGEKVRFILADVFGGMAKHADDDKHAARRKAYSDAGDVIDVETISLDEFLTRHEAPRNIDFISVDTEGSEYDILSTFPFEKWNVSCWTIEHNFSPIRDKIYTLMCAHGYERVEAKWDDWYYR